jgi:biotin carboxyl carrier protein
VIFQATAEGRTVRVEVRRKDGRYAVSLDGRLIEVDLHEAGPHFLSLLIDGRSHEVGLEKHRDGYAVVFQDDVITVELADATRSSGAAARKGAAGQARLVAPMPGKLTRVLVEAGQDVAAGQGLVVMEAMKMENEIRAPRAGRVKELLVREGQAVETGALLAVVE